YARSSIALAMGSVTFGHGELSHDVPLEFSKTMSFSEFCDGMESCIHAARKVLRDGADFILE
ncbi:hypothetical protein, partial [Morganella morganii]|uniref:hypothetical protein n=1 Tax=Morganella morganii TaxID=582 RepID=UPI00195459AA